MVHPWRALAEQVEVRPEAPAVSDPERSLTYQQVGVEVLAAAAALEQAGVRRGDVVSILMDNRVTSVVWTWAVARLGAVGVLLNPRLREADLRFALEDSGSVVLVGARSLGRSGLTEAAKGWVADKDLALWSLQDEDAPVAGEPDAEFAPPSPEDIVWILYTSGTTSQPKGVALSCQNLANSRKISAGLDPSDVTFLSYPLSAITACHNGVLASFLIGASVVLDGPAPSMGAVVSRLSRGDITHLACHRLYLKKLSPFLPQEPLHIAKASIFPRLATDRPLYQALGNPGLVVGYGMTETTGPVTYGSGYSLEAALDENCDGIPVAAQVQIRDLETRAEVPAGELGEIWVRGPQVSPGYWQRRGAPMPLGRPDGWLPTGDVGRQGEPGCIHYVHRASDTFKSRGFTVSPGEIEELIRTIPWVHDCVVCGVATTDDMEVAVLIELEPGVPVSADPVDEVIQQCRAGLASFKVPRSVLVVEEMPRTRTGKPHRPVVLDLLRAHHVKAAS